jgi:hypothetical protein
MATPATSGTAAAPVPLDARRSESEQEQALLQRAFEDQENARKRFIRDFKLIFLTVVAFHFLIFLRSIALWKEAARVGDQVRVLTDQRTAAHDFQSGLEKVIATVSAGKTNLTTSVSLVPQQLNGQMRQLDSELEELRQFGGSPPDRMPAQSPAQIGIQNRAPGILSVLSAEQHQQLTSPDPRVVRAGLTPIVRERILQPAFQQLNEQVRTSMLLPFAAEKTTFLNTLRQRSATLKTIGIDTKSISAELDQMQARLQKLSFKMPASDQWWATYAGKVATLGSQNLDVQRVSDDVLHQLSNLTGSASEVEMRLAKLLQEAERQLVNVNQEIKKLEDRNGEIQALMADTAKPLKLMALQLEESVRYFPVVVAIALAYLAFGYSLQFARALRLSVACSELGLSRSVIRVYFANVPGFTLVSAALVVAAFTMIVGLVFWDAHSITTSAVLSSTAPRGLYVSAEAVSLISLGACLTLIALERRRQTGRHSQKLS